MKITIDIDCTPEEARIFLGLPDVQPMQQALMDQLQQRMAGYLQAMEPEAMVRTWLPLGLQNWEQMQKMFWAQMGGGGGSAASGGGGARSGSGTAGGRRGDDDGG
jgi:hypothetical protein